MSSQRRRGGVFARHGRSDHQSGGHRAEQATGFTKMTVVDVLGSFDELAGGTGGSIDAITGGPIDPHIGRVMRRLASPAQDENGV